MASRPRRGDLPQAGDRGASPESAQGRGTHRVQAEDRAGKTQGAAATGCAGDSERRPAITLLRTRQRASCAGRSPATVREIVWLQLVLRVELGDHAIDAIAQSGGLRTVG